jgi:hypothetical protein
MAETVMKSFARVSGVMVLLCLLAAQGCGKSEEIPENRAVVEGKITHDGQPLNGGTITFMLESDKNYRVNALIKPGGVYSSNRIPVGKCNVTIETDSLKLGNERDFVPISFDYSLPDKSGLSADIKPGTNRDVNFDLEKKP